MDKTVLVTGKSDNLNKEDLGNLERKLMQAQLQPMTASGGRLQAKSKGNLRKYLTGQTISGQKASESKENYAPQGPPRREANVASATSE